MKNEKCMLLKTVKTYKFKDLPETVQTKLINNEIEMLGEMAYLLAPNSKVCRAIRIAEDNQTPWFFGEIYYHELNGKKDILKTLSKYDYTKSGIIIEDIKE